MRNDHDTLIQCGLAKGRLYTYFWDGALGPVGLQITKYFVINIKCAKWNEAGHKNFPGCFPEFPLLLYANLQSIENKQQK